MTKSNIQNHKNRNRNRQIGYHTPKQTKEEKEGQGVAKSKGTKEGTNINVLNS